MEIIVAVLKKLETIHNLTQPLLGLQTDSIPLQKTCSPMLIDKLSPLARKLTLPRFSSTIKFARFASCKLQLSRWNCEKIMLSLYLKCITGFPLNLDSDFNSLDLSTGSSQEKKKERGYSGLPQEGSPAEHR